MSVIYALCASARKMRLGPKGKYCVAMQWRVSLIAVQGGRVGGPNTYARRIRPAQG